MIKMMLNLMKVTCSKKFQVTIYHIWNTCFFWGFIHENMRHKNCHVHIFFSILIRHNNEYFLHCKICFCLFYHHLRACLREIESRLVLQNLFLFIILNSMLGEADCATRMYWDEKLLYKHEKWMDESIVHYIIKINHVLYIFVRYISSEFFLLQRRLPSFRLSHLLLKYRTRSIAFKLHFYNCQIRYALIESSSLKSWVPMQYR